MRVRAAYSSSSRNLLPLIVQSCSAENSQIASFFNKRISKIFLKFSLHLCIYSWHFALTHVCTVRTKCDLKGSWRDMDVCSLNNLQVKKAYRVHLQAAEWGTTGVLWPSLSLQANGHGCIPPAYPQHPVFPNNVLDMTHALMLTLSLDNRRTGGMS